MKKLCLSAAIALSLLACEDEETSTEIVSHTTPDGWQYDYVHLKDKKDGWKITIMANSSYLFEPHNIWTRAIAPQLLLESGYADVPTVDKLANMESLDSNANIYNAPTQIIADIYVKKGEEEEFLPAVIGTFQDPKFDPERFDILKEDYTEGFSQYADKSLPQSFRAASFGLFHDGPFQYSAPYGESLEKIEALNLQDIEEWFSDVKSLDGFRIGIAGAEGVETLDPYIDQMLAGLSQEPTSYFPPEEIVNQEGKIIVIERDDVESAQFFASAAWPKMESQADVEAIWFANNAFGYSSETSKLSKIREDLRASYGFSSSFEDLSDVVYTINYTGETDLENAPETFKKLQSILDEFRDQPLSDDEFEAVISYNKDVEDEVKKDENSVAYALAAVQGDRFYSEPFEFFSNIVNAQKDVIVPKIQELFPPKEQWVQVVVTNDASQFPADCVIKSDLEVESCFE